MPAVLVNTATVLCGSLIGILLGSRLKESLRDAVMKALGLCTALIGIQSALGTKELLCVILCMVLGTVLGSTQELLVSAALTMPETVSGKAPTR